ncbi:MAG: hypothetical protein ACJAZT_001983 [Gammaproteobacteria bacterium]|jgi:hypothetical protein
MVDFFWSINNAAASASAFSFRCSSFFNALFSLFEHLFSTVIVWFIGHVTATQFILPLLNMMRVNPLFTTNLVYFNIGYRTTTNLVVSSQKSFHSL